MWSFCRECLALLNGGRPFWQLFRGISQALIFTMIVALKAFCL